MGGRKLYTHCTILLMSFSKIHALVGVELLLCILFFFVFSYQRFDPVIGIQQIADGGIMVQRIDDIGDILAHVAADIVRLG